MNTRSDWVDLDDVLAQTIEGLVDLLARHNGRRVEVESVADFDLSRSFGLDRNDLERFFDHAHSDEELRALEPVVGAAPALRSWRDRGFEVHVVTGRPPICAEASRCWLETHGMAHDAIHFVDKYGRAAEVVESVPFIQVDEMLERAFTWAVEDSLDMATRLARDAEVPVALIDRPWNRLLPGPAELPEAARRRIVRCHTWAQVESVTSLAGRA